MENNQNNSNKNNNNNNRRSGGFFTYLIFFMLLILLAIWVFRFFRKDNSTEITYNEFLQMVEQQKIEKVIIHSETIEIKEAGDENNISSLFFGSSKPSLYTGRMYENIKYQTCIELSGISPSTVMPFSSSLCVSVSSSSTLPV